MKRILFVSTLLAAFVGLNISLHAQVSGLQGWTIYLDPGHSQTENMGLYNYSEAEKVLRVGLALRDMLEERTDIGTVYMSRENDEVYVTLSQRSDHANQVNADFYYSIHSDAGASQYNSTLFLYGGWRKDGQTVEKDPKGGKRMGDIMDMNLPNHMRIPTRGNYADRTFYYGFPDNHSRQYPYLHVNRETIMASILSEGGFHTNPTQQMRNFNAEWKRLEAQSAFWSILEFHEIERPPYGIVTGFIRDLESGKLLNGVEVTIGAQTYTTDSYESLFNKYSDDPEQLRNGFYYLEDLPHGDTLDVYVNKQGYYEDTERVAVEADDMTFLDFNLVSSQPPYVTKTDPVHNEERASMSGYVRIYFSRPMNPDSTEQAITVTPAIEGLDWLWNENHTQIVFSRNQLDFLTEYTITVGAAAEDTYGHKFDGDNDGQGGGSYQFTFTTAPEDTDPPQISQQWPLANQRDLSLFPIVSFTFDEKLDDASVHDSTITVRDHTDRHVTGTVEHYTVNDTSVVQFFPDEALKPNTRYTATLLKGVEDIYDNATLFSNEFQFYTGTVAEDDIEVIDDFDGGLDAWWHPEQSGSTVGYVPDETARTADAVTVNLLTASAQAMKLSYGWDTGSGSHLIREYLGGGAPKNVTFNAQQILEVFLFGDGSGNQFRFVVQDDNNDLEASSWYTVDWIGWKRVQWNLSEDPVHGWARTPNGVLDGDLIIDSFQLTYADNGAQSGAVFFDDLRAIRTAPTSIEPITENAPRQYRLEQNYPNPFNPITHITFEMPDDARVRLEIFDVNGQKVQTAINGYRKAGVHEVVFDGAGMASGVYIYRLSTDKGPTLTRKMFLIK